VDGVAYTDALGFGTVAMTLPTADGSANQVLKTDGSGALSFTSVATSVNGLSDALVENTGSMYIGNDPSSTTDAADYNVAVGATALDAITTGDSNTALGYDALSANLGGNRNTAVGTSALRLNTTGITNVAVGSSALDRNTTSNSNTAVGHASSYLLNSGASNVTVGYESAKAVTSADNNVIIGSGANPSANTGTSNQVAVGYGVTGVANNSVTLGNADVTAIYMAQDVGATIYASSLDASGSAGIVLENDETVTNSTNGTVLINGTVASGTGSAAGVFQSNGNHDVTLQTGNSTTGSITITDGANGDITVAPNGTGKTDFNDNAITGYGADLQTESGTTKTLAAADNGTIIVCSSSSAVTITVPASLPSGFNCMIIQSGSGQVSLSASSTTLNNRNGSATAGQYAIMTLVHLGSNVFVVSGDTTS
jgi:hypothetical protein